MILRKPNGVVETVGYFTPFGSRTVDVMDEYYWSSMPITENGAPLWSS